MVRKNRRKAEKIWISGSQLRKSSLAVTLCFTILLTALCVKVAYIQFVKGAEYQQMAYDQHTKKRAITAKRGTIYDRNGSVLAMSATVYRIIVNPRDIRNDKKRQDNMAQHQINVAKKLAEILELDYHTVYEKVLKNSAYQEIKRKIKDDPVNKLREWITEEEIAGIYIDEDAMRNYPNNSLAAHVIGYTGSDDQGLSGIESIYEEYLKGTNGYILTEVDGAQKSMSTSEEVRVNPVNGNNVILTIDETIQYLVEKSLEKEIENCEVIGGAACIVMDPKTGEILAMASNPTFNLNEPFAAPEGIGTEKYNIDKATWTGRTQAEVDILNKTVWRNKALSDSYEPGSTFKTITSAILFEENAVTKNTMVSDSPYLCSGHTIHCWRKSRIHGPETFEKAVHNSCNPVFAKLAVERIGIEKFYTYIDKFGFYTKSGIDFPGEGTSLFHKEPTNINLATAAFGQRFQITPLQLATAYCAIANGGELLVPQLVKEITDQSGNTIEKFEKESVRQVVSPQTCKEVLEILEGVVSEGTGSNAYVKGLRIAGKTGTSQTLTTKTNGRYIVSFCGIAPADNPEIVCLYILDHPNIAQTNLRTGGALAAPAAGKLMEEILNYLRVERIYSDNGKDEIEKSVSVPMVQNIPLNDARSAITKSGLKVKVIGSENGEAKVVRQIPEAGYSIPEGSNVILYMTKEANQEVVVPDLTGMKVSEAFEELNKKNLCIKIYGTGTVKSQEPAAGTKCPIGTIITVDFRIYDENSDEQSE